MPQLNNSEKRLLLILGTVAFLAANVFGYLMVSAFMKGLAAEEVKLKKRLNDPDGLEDAKSKAALADETRQWIDDHLKAPLSEEDRETFLDGIINTTLTQGLDIELSKSSTLPTIFGEHFVKSRFRTNAKGPWPDVKEFIYRLQKPDEFRFVPRLTLLPRKNELDDAVQLVEVSLEIEKWWPKPDNYNDDNTAPAEIEQPAGETVQPPAAATAAVPPAPVAPGDTPAPAVPTTPSAETSPAVVTPPAPPVTPAPDSN